MFYQIFFSPQVTHLGTSIKTDKNAIMISVVVARKDRYKDKAGDTNEFLKKLFSLWTTVTLMLELI